MDITMEKPVRVCVGISCIYLEQMDSRMMLMEIRSRNDIYVG